MSRLNTNMYVPFMHTHFVPNHVENRKILAGWTAIYQSYLYVCTCASTYVSRPLAWASHTCLLRLFFFTQMDFVVLENFKRIVTRPGPSFFRDIMPPPYLSRKFWNDWFAWPHSGMHYPHAHQHLSSSPPSHEKFVLIDRPSWMDALEWSLDWEDA